MSRLSSPPIVGQLPAPRRPAAFCSQLRPAVAFCRQPEEGGTRISRLPFDAIGDTIPAVSICSTSRAARL
jgi:hypothetical protein